MTLTYPVLNRARRILWVVTGAEKMTMLGRLLDGDLSIPAGRVRRGQSWWLPIAPQQENLLLDLRKGYNMRVGIATDHGGFTLKRIERLGKVAALEAQTICQ